MCGLAGIIKTHASGGEIPAVARMLQAMAHRGPDGEGIYRPADKAVFLGHKRLAIIDPEHGAQPMTTDDGQLTVIFNGVIYNYLELRRELVASGHRIRSYSDTEVVLYAFREWGEDCVSRFLGMFAFAIWDNKNNRLFCARDRLGIKPFYYACDGKNFVFASEIKALLATGMLEAARDEAGLKDYLTFQFCLGDKTLYRNVSKLLPGHSLSLPVNGKRLEPEIRKYWDVAYDMIEDKSEAWFAERLTGLIEDSVRLHLRSDVPLGAHLSGGLDSSAIVCLASALLNGERLKTFTGAFREGPAFDETAYAKIVAGAANTDYHETYIDGADVPEILPRLTWFMDEPVAGPGLISQYYVSRLAAQHVKVVLGGQGGDEIFIGYARYLAAYLEQCLAGAINETANPDRYAVSLASIIPNLPLLQAYRPMLQDFWRDGMFSPMDQRYFRLINRSESTADLLSSDVTGMAYSPFDAFQEIFNQDDLHSLVNRMTHFDLKQSLPALLHVEDRTSMAVSIESRVPFLDHRIVEFMARVPTNIKFAGGQMKYLFKKSIKNTIPAAIFDRKDKMGFPTPLPQWCRGVAREFVCDTLLSGRARQRGLYNSRALEKAIDNEHAFGRAVWGLLSIELWHRAFIDNDANNASGDAEPAVSISKKRIKIA